MVTERADIWWFGTTLGYNLTPYYQLLGSLHVLEIFKKLAAENRDEILLIITPPICNIGSPLCDVQRSCYLEVW